MTKGEAINMPINAEKLQFEVNKISKRI